MSVHWEKQSGYILYDPDYKVESIDKTFIQKEDLIQEIQKILEPNIVIRFFSVEPRATQSLKLTQRFNRLIQHPEKALSLLQQTGLHMITSHAPEILNPVLKTIHDANAKQTAETFLKALAYADQDGWTGLQMIEHHAPEMLPNILMTITKGENTEQNTERLLHTLTDQDIIQILTGLITVPIAAEGDKQEPNLRQVESSYDAVDLTKKPLTRLTR